MERLFGGVNGVCPWSLALCCLAGKWSDYPSPGTLIGQGKGALLLVLSAGFMFRKKAGQPELCPEVLTFRGDKLFKEGHT